MTSEPAKRPAWTRPLLIAMVALLGIAALVGLHFATHYEVLEKGQLLPYTRGVIYKVRFGGVLTLYVEPEARPSLDLLHAYFLTGIAFISLTFAAILAKAQSDTHSLKFWFFIVSFVGASYLAADELLGIHETIGHNMQCLAALPMIKRPDDALVMFMAVPAAAVLYVFRTVIMASRRAMTLFGVAFIGFLFAALADVLSLWGEEVLEVLVSVLLTAAMMTLGLHHTSPKSSRGSTIQ